MLCTVENHHLPVLEEVMGSQSSIALATADCSSNWMIYKHKHSCFSIYIWPFNIINKDFSFRHFRKHKHTHTHTETRQGDLHHYKFDLQFPLIFLTTVALCKLENQRRKSRIWIDRSWRARFKIPFNTRLQFFLLFFFTVETIIWIV